MQKTISQLEVGSMGTFDITIPKITYTTESEGPNIVFVATQHGNEVTPLFVLDSLFEFLSKNPLQKGKLTILPVANPMGLVFNSRREPIDGVNLNRSFPGSKTGDFGKRLAVTIMDECADATFVVDLHTFSRQCGYVGILVKTGDGIEDECRKALKAIQPDCIWYIDMERKEDKRFTGSLDIVLASQGVPAITLEMERHQTISQEKVDEVVASLIRMLEAMGMLSSNTNELEIKDTPMFVAKYLYCDTAGIFVPSKDILTTVSQGDVVGTITDLKTFSKTDVIAPHTGTLLTLRFKDFVRTGTKLGSIGEQVGTL